jgi:amino acid adenylation domain-containing protein
MEEPKKSEQKSTLQAWLNRKNKIQQKAEIQVMEESLPTVLSYGQQRLWLLQQLFPDNPFYQYSHLYRFRGSLNILHLETAFGEVVQRHSILRTSFIRTDEGIRQFAQADLKANIQVHDLREFPTEDREAEANKRISQIARQPFDLSRPPLFRLNLLQLADDQHWLLFDVHHIIGDRWSLEIINREIATYYSLLQNGTFSSPTPLDFQYADYARDQQTRGIADEDLEFWQQELSGELPGLALPQDFIRPAQPSFAGDIIHRHLPMHLSRGLKDLCKSLQTTPFVLFLAAFKALLCRYTGQNDILVGSPFSNRDHSSLEKLIGFFNETLVLRSRLSPEMSFKELVAQLKKGTLKAFAHKNMPFDVLVRQLKPERGSTYNPFFEVMFLYNTPVPDISFGVQVELEEEMLDLGSSKFDLTLYLNERSDHLQLSLEYSTDLFKASTIDRLLAHFENLLAGILKKPDSKIHELPLLGDEERHRMVMEWNSTLLPLPELSGIHQLLEQRARRQPKQTALTDDLGSLSYETLNRRADRLAHQLINSGLKINQIVGLYSDRGTDLFVGMFGILKAGAAYLPLDPEYPAERIRFMLEDSGAEWIVTQQNLADLLPADKKAKLFLIESIDTTFAEAVPLPELQADDLAYIIYTSGSTGQPKGVPISHRNLIHSTSARFHFYPKNPGRFLLLSSFSFDSSVAGIFWTLCSGGTLVLPPKRIEQDLAALTSLIKTNAVSHTLLLPSLYGLLLQHASITDLSSLQCVIVAGEACAPALADQHFRRLPKTSLYNEYGPTEATVWCIAHEIKPEDARSSIPIGRPISNVQAYVLDQQLNPVPPGVPGELYIAGAGVSKGYLNRHELTRERFLPIPFVETTDARMYKTGDLVRYRDNGILDYLGRADHQVKIRGYRVEPEEIANHLLEYEGVTDAVVLAERSGSGPAAPLRLIAYLAGLKQDKIPELKQYLHNKLPSYMVPVAILALSELPRLPNGKLDRKGLPKAEEIQISQTSGYQAPATELEIYLAQIWQEALGLEQIGTNDNFFEIGGDSLLSIKMVAIARKKGIGLAPNQLFQYQTIARLASSIMEKAAFSSLVPLKREGSQNPLFCIHSGGAHVFFYRAFAAHLPERRPVYALQPAGLDGTGEYPGSIEDMAAHYIREIRAVQAAGPYHILGTCFSNAVALEMGNQLRAIGEQVDLYIIDSGPVHLVGDASWGKSATFRRLFDLLQRGDFSRIKRKLLNRIRPQQKNSVTWEAISSDHELRSVVERMNEAYAHYSWTPFPGRIRFIRSSEFHGRKDKKYHLQQWLKLAGDGLEVHVVPGHHLTLFEEPEVQSLAECIASCLSAENI